jgi:hypothetical protein
MINTQLLYKIWNPNLYQVENCIDFYAISFNNKLLDIYIYNDETFQQEHLFNLNIRKNCFIERTLYYNKIYIHENYIQFIIRQRLLNSLLND